MWEVGKNRSIEAERAFGIILKNDKSKYSKAPAYLQLVQEER